MRNSAQHGFTLIELVITITISVVVVSFVSMFISGPVGGFVDQTRRARLVDAADGALRRIGRDVRRALPNSVRTRSLGGIVALEVLSTVDGGRYRREPSGATSLEFAAPDAQFNVIGPFTQISKPFSSSDHYLAIYNVGIAGADAYELANVMTPPGTQIDVAFDAVSGEDLVTLTPAFRFAYGSPTQRIYLVDGAITYLCNPLAGTLTRYTGYDIAADQADVDSDAELIGANASASLMATEISACAFTYAPGTAERAGLVTLEFTVSAQGEAISLLSQVHVDNAP